MLRRLTGWFAPPALADPERSERARTLAWVVVATLGVGIPTLALMIVVQPTTLARRGVSLVVLIALGLAVQALNRRERTALGSWILVVGVFGLLFDRSLTSGGVSAPQASGFLVVVLLAGLLLGARGGLIVATTVLLAGLAMVLADRAGLLPVAEAPFTPLIVWLFTAIWVSLALTVQALYARSVSRALRRVEDELAHRERAQRQLQDAFETLRATEEKLSRVFAAVPVGVIVTTFADGAIVEANDEFERMFGWTRAELIGRRTLDLGLWQSRDDRSLALEAVESGAGRTDDIQLRLAGRDGRIREIRASAHGLVLDGERMIISTYVDVTDRLRAEADRARAEALHREVVEGVRDVVFALTPDGLIVALNPAFQQLTGMSPGSWINRPFHELLHDDDAPRAMAELNDSLAGRAGSNPPLRVRRADGGYLHAEINVSPRFEAGQLVGIFGIGRDVSERVEAERARARAEAARAQALSDLGERLKELRLLHLTARLFQRDSGDLRQLLAQWIAFVPQAWRHPAHCEARVTIGDIVLSTAGWRDSPWRQAQVFDAGGTPGTLEVVYLEAMPEAGEGPFLAEERALLGSLTEMLVAHIELRRHREQLEALVQLRTTELRVAKYEADRANRAKSAFLATMSHEIRTPLNAMLGYAQLLHRDRAVGTEQQRQIGAILSSGDHLLALINDVLEIARIESGRVSVVSEPVELARLLEDTELMFAELARTRQVRLRFTSAPGLVPVVGSDRAKIRQVLINLVGNAVKFTPAGGTVEVRAAS